MSDYEQQLRRELADLRTRRVQLRQLIGKGVAYQAAGDWLDNQRCLEQRKLYLRATEKRWQELHHLLRINPPGPAVKLDAPVRRTVQAAPVRRSAPTGYMNKMLTGR